MLDVFVRTFFTAKACLKLDKQRQFVDCKKIGKCVGKSMAGLVEVYACQLLNEKFHVKGREKMTEAAPVYQSGVKVKS